MIDTALLLGIMLVIWYYGHSLLAAREMDRTLNGQSIRSIYEELQAISKSLADLSETLSQK